MGKLKEKLAECCLMYKIDRFSPDEMIELIKDGEEVEWIVEQVVSGGGDRIACSGPVDADT